MFTKEQLRFIFEMMVKVANRVTIQNKMNFSDDSLKKLEEDFIILFPQE